MGCHGPSTTVGMTEKGGGRESGRSSVDSWVSSGWVRLNCCHGPSTLVGMTEKAVALLRRAGSWGWRPFAGANGWRGLSSRPERPAFSCARFPSAGRVVEGPWQGCSVTQVDGTKPRLQRGNSSLRSRNLGFIRRISASFFSRRHRLICFSRLIALRTSPKPSK